MGLTMTILAELADVAAGVAPELIAFIGAAGGTLVGVGMTIGVLKKRFEDAEKGVAAATEACKSATENAVKLREQEGTIARIRRRFRRLEKDNQALRDALSTLVRWMVHGEGAVPKAILDEISSVLAVTQARTGEESI